MKTQKTQNFFLIGVVLALFIILTVGVAEAASQPYVVAVKVAANQSCESSEGMAAVAGSRVTAIFADGTRRQFITGEQGTKFLATGEVILEIEFPTAFLPCPNSPTRRVVNPPDDGGPIVPPPAPPVPLVAEVSPPGFFSLPAVSVEFRAMELQREN